MSLAGTGRACRVRAGVRVERRRPLPRQCALHQPRPIRTPPGAITVWDESYWCAPCRTLNWTVEEVLERHSEAEVSADDLAELGRLFYEYSNGRSPSPPTGALPYAVLRDELPQGSRRGLADFRHPSTGNVRKLGEAHLHIDCLGVGNESWQVTSDRHCCAERPQYDIRTRTRQSELRRSPP